MVRCYTRTTTWARSLVLVCTIASLAAASTRPAKREYDTHTYYVVELDHAQLPIGTTPAAVAEALGAQHVEQVGELDGYYLIRAPVEAVKNGEPAWRDRMMHKRGGEAQPVERDLVMERYDLLRRGAGQASRLHARGASQPERRISADAILSLERQYPRQRVKRDLPVLPPSNLPRSLSRRTPSPPRHPLRRQDETGDSSIITEVARAFSIEDPLWPKQWHLVNGQVHDNSINVTGVWSDGVLGEGINVAIVDDGLDMHSDDLAPNFHAEGSWDYNDNTPLPEPRLSDDQHGTRCAGEIAAAKNDVCGVGVAYKAGIAGIRILSASISDADEASALNYGYQTNDIYSCSWGPPDDGKSMEAPGRLIQQAMLNGVQRGRGGKGSIFVFASGNGGGVDDQCNFDGYTNSLMSITVGAIDRKNLHPFYSEACAANLVVTYSSGSGDNIHTTDVGKNVCTDRHGGTSAAAPIAAGIFALVLQVRPDLTWRDMQHLCVQSAVQINPSDPDWQMTASGRAFNHKYGFGKLDAWAIVNAARSWELVKPQAWWISNEATSGQTITAEGVSSTHVVTAESLRNANVETLEHVTVTVNVEHQRRGNIEVELLSPRGMKSILARPRRFDDATTGMPNWVFMTVKHWDEDPVGTWTLTVKDRQTNGKNGTFNNWSMQLWGAAIDAAAAKPWRIPRPGVDNADETAEDDAAATESPTTTDEAPTPVDDATKQFPKPTEHLPDDHAEAEGEAHQPFGDPITAPAAEPTPEPELDDVEEPTTLPTDNEYFEDGATGYLTGMRNLLSSSTWLFVAGGTIIVFVAGVTAFFVLRRRPRLGRSGGYDFAPQTDEEDGLPMRSLERGRLSLPNSARTRELYDAFRLDSDEDDSEDEADDREPLRLRSDVAYTDDAMTSFLDEPEAPTTAAPVANVPRRPSGEAIRSAREEFSD